MTEKNKNKINLAEKISEELGIPKNIVSGFNHIELFGNHEAIVNDCKGILEYGSEKIKINMGKNIVSFTGNDLFMNEYGSSRAKICGTIITVEFS